MFFSSLFRRDCKTSPDFLSAWGRADHDWILIFGLNLSFKLWKLPTRLPKHLLTRTNMNSVTHAAAVFTLHTSSSQDTGLRRQKHPAGSFQTWPQPATGQDRHYNTEKSTRLSPSVHKHTPTDHFCTQHRCVFKEGAERHRVCLHNFQSAVAVFCSW